jgi:hypothetical protein
MKKILMIMLTFFVAGFLFAQEEKKEEKKPEFKFSGAVYAYGATYKTTAKNEAMSFGAYRFRPYFSYLTENVEATVKFEIDQFLGKETAGNGADIGNDEKMLEVKSAFLAFKIPAIKGLSIKGGVDEYKTPGGFIIGTEAGLGLITYKFDKHSFNLLYLKNEEKKSNLQNDDSTLMGLDMTIGIGEMKIRPAFYILANGKNFSATDEDSLFLLPSLGFSMKIGSLGLDVNGTYGTGEKKTAGIKTTLSGFAFDINPSFEIEKGIKIHGFFTLVSGNKADTTTKNEAFSSFTLKADGYGRLFLLQNQQSFTNVPGDTFADIRGKSQGYLLFGMGADMKISAFSILLNIAYGQLAQEVSSIKNKKDLGIEADLSLGYEVEKNAKLVLDLAYLATGKAFGTDGFGTSAVQDSIYCALGMSYKF